MRLEYGEQRISVAAGDSIIGSDTEADLVLTGPVLPRHAVVRRSGENVVLLRVDPRAPISVNGSPVGGSPVPLLHGDRIAIAGHEILVSDPSRSGPTRAMPAAERPRVEPVERLGGRLVSLHDGREYPITVVPFVLGRDAAASVVVGSPDASRRHAEIVTRPDGDVLVDLSANGTFVNGKRIDGRHQLAALDVIRIGAEEFRYYPEVAPAGPPPGAAFRLSDTLVGLPSVATPPRPVPAAPPLATLLIRSGQGKGDRIAVRAPVVNIGRAPFNEVQLGDPSVSASHAKLQLREGVWTLTDLGSTNRTAVDGVDVTDDCPLSPGATLKFGDVTLSFEPRDDRPVLVPRTAVMTAPAAEDQAEPPPRRTPPSRPAPGAPPQPLGLAGGLPEPAGNGNRGTFLVVVTFILLAGLAALIFLV
ncbi:MAG: FHA domain-containing protein [Gemmatimonadales bacterium]